MASRPRDMNIRKIIREEIKKVNESSYDIYPDFFDPIYNPNIKKYPPVGNHSYGEMVKEESLEEDYPSSFDMEHFKSLKSFNARIKYCEEHLQRISSGSSRIAYKIDDQKVLKLAKNKAGIAQNELEFESAKYSDLQTLVAAVFDRDENYLWIEMELAEKLSKGDFKNITGFDFGDFSKAIHNYAIDTVMVDSRHLMSKMDISKDVVEDMWEDEFVYDVFNYMPNYDVPPGDLMKTSSYGVVNRGGDKEIVLVDYGFNKDIHQNYYS